MSDFHLKAGDLAITIEGTVGGVADLTGVTAIAFEWAARGSTTFVELAGTAEVVDAAARTVRYTFAAGETDTAGEYAGRFKLTFGAAGVGKCPGQGGISIRIEP